MHRKEIVIILEKQKKSQLSGTMDHVDIAFHEFAFNPFGNILLRGALLCAGNMEKHNCMTINWASLGQLWNKNIVTVFVRPKRYTNEFIDNSMDFSINFLSPEYREVLAIMGTFSGREVDKIKECDLSPVKSKTIKSPSIKQAQLIFECAMLFRQPMGENSISANEILNLYPEKDYHKIYIAEVKRICGNPKFII